MSESYKYGKEEYGKDIVMKIGDKKRNERVD